MTLEQKLEEHLFLDVKIYPKWRNDVRTETEHLFLDVEIYPATFVRFPIIKTGVTSIERERLGEHLWKRWNTT